MVEYKKCTGECGVVKELNKDNFRWRNDKKNYVAKCLLCEKDYSIKYNKKFSKENGKRFYNKNRDKLKISKKQWRKNNPEKTKEIQKKSDLKRKDLKKEYRQNNKEHFRNYKREYEKNRLNNDIIYKLHSNIARSIRQNLKNNNLIKNKSINELLPYTSNELKQYLESQFEPWMTWNNYGKYNSKTWNDNDQSTWTWQIDHIIPKSTFEINNDDEFLKCWDLSNLRPYSAKQNVIDGTRRTRHIKKLEE